MSVRFAKGVEHLLVPIDSVHQHALNPNNGDLDKLIESIQVNGFVTAVTADSKTGNIIAGNHRWQALHALGATHIPVIYVDHMDDTGAVRYMIADNQTGRLAVMDQRAELALLEKLRETEIGLAGSGFDQNTYEQLIIDLANAGTQMPDSEYGHEPAPSGIYQVVVDFYDPDERDQLLSDLRYRYENVRGVDL